MMMMVMRYTLPYFVTLLYLVHAIDYLGCFKDEDDPDRALTGVEWTAFGTMTNELCASACAADNYTYSGTEAGGYCFCGDDEDYSKHGPYDECYRYCPGDRMEYCGGHWAISMYTNTFDQIHIYTTRENHWIPVDTWLPGSSDDFQRCLRDCLFGGFYYPSGVISGNLGCQCVVDFNQEDVVPSSGTSFHEYMQAVNKSSVFMMTKKGEYKFFSVPTNPAMTTIGIKSGTLQEFHVESKGACAHLCISQEECDFFLIDIISETKLLCTIFKSLM